MRVKSWFPSLLGVLVLAVGTAAQSPLKPIQFSDTRLANGLRVIISEDHYAPMYAIAVSYGVGSKDERAGPHRLRPSVRAHDVQGFRQRRPGEHFFLIFNYGGNMNGTTNTDRTLYFETLPKNQLDLGLFLEADRMRSLAITKENLDNQRQAVQEERRLGLDNQPYGKSQERFNELAYDNFAYKHSVIGSMEDLNAATVDDVASFFRTYYAPNNAVRRARRRLDTKATLAKVEKYFGSIPRQPNPMPVDLSEPEMNGRAPRDDARTRSHASPDQHGLQDPAGDARRLAGPFGARDRSSAAARARGCIKRS